MRTSDRPIKTMLTRTEFVVLSPFRAPSGLRLQCLNFLRELNPTGISSPSRHQNKANTRPGFLLKRKSIWPAQGCLLRRRFSLGCSSGRILNDGIRRGMLSFVSTLILHGPFTQSLTMIKSPYCLRLWLSLVNRDNPVSSLLFYSIHATHYGSDFLG